VTRLEAIGGGDADPVAGRSAAGSSAAVPSPAVIPAAVVPAAVVPAAVIPAAVVPAAVVPAAMVSEPAARLAPVPAPVAPPVAPKIAPVVPPASSAPAAPRLRLPTLKSGPGTPKTGIPKTGTPKTGTAATPAAPPPTQLVPPQLSPPLVSLSPAEPPRRDSSKSELPELGGTPDDKPAENIGGASGASENTEPSRFSTEEMHEIRTHPRVRDVLDTFRGRIENVKREQ
jgi:hypothetical protein